MSTYKITMQPRKHLIYLDQAATTYPKPPEVIEAMTTFMRDMGGNPGRSSHALALSSAREVFACRNIASEMFDTTPDRVIFTTNTTQALNMAIKGLLPACKHKKPHILCSDMEHNAVYRPLWRLQQEGKITFDTFDTLPLSPYRTTEAILASIRRKIRPDTSMIVCAHASNICSAVLPIREIGKLCHAMGILFVVDGAQSAGCLPIRMREMHIDALCLPGHKGLLGPMGVGMLMLGEHITLDTLIEGGNGVDSLRGDMGDDAPERYEAGTLPAPCIAGLRAGLQYIKQVGIDEIFHHEQTLGGYVVEALANMPHVKVYAPNHRGGVVLFSVSGMSSEEAGGVLDAGGFCLRPGFHCSALGHTTLGTPSGGALRGSFGYLNTKKEAEALVLAVRHLQK